MSIYLLARTTIIEILRQPSFFLIFFGTGLMIVLTPFFTMFAFYDTKRLLIEMGLASIAVMSLVAISFASSHAIFSEIKRKTTLLLLTKPISMLSFLLGKYFGVIFCGSILIFFHGLLLFFVIRMGAPETSAYVVDQPAVMAVIGTLVFSLLYGFFQNYFNGKNFCSHSIGGALFFITFFFLVVGFFDRHWALTSYWKDFSFELLKGVFLIFLAMLILGAFSLATSAYFKKDINLIITFVFFILGLMSDRFFGAFQDQNLLYAFAYRLIPNFHVFLVSDTIIFYRYIPISYMMNALYYTMFFLSGILLIALVAFEKKEIS